jgi:hypothetical protein
LLSHLAPEFIDAHSQLTVRHAARAATRTYDDIHRREFMLMHTEGFADDAPDAVALDMPARRFRGDGQAQTRPALIVATRSHGEEPVPHAPAARVYSFEVRLPPQAPLRGKSVSLGMRAAASHGPGASAQRFAQGLFFFKE